MNGGSREGRSHVAQARWALAAATLLVVYLTLSPFRFDAEPSSLVVPWVGPRTRGDWVDVAANLLFHVPLGFLFVAGRAGGRWSAGAAVVYCLGLSYAIETAQLFAPNRDSSLLDVLMNGLGGAAGAGLAWLAGRRSAGGLFSLNPVSWWLLACWIVWTAFPFVPSLRMTQLEASIGNVRREIASLDIPVLAAGDFLLSAAVLGAAARGRRAGFCTAAIALAAVASRGVLRGHTLSAVELAASAAGLAMGFALPLGWFGWPLLAWLGIREIYPANWSFEPQTFQWMPLAATFDLPVEQAGPIVAGKLLLYSACFWALRRARLGAGAALACVLAVLAAGEAAQVFLPGRTPETADLLLAVLGAAAVYWAEGREGGGARRAS